MGQSLIDSKKEANEILKKIEKTGLLEHQVEEVKKDPFSGTGKPEKLKHALAGCWSRRIAQEHWLVHRVLSNYLISNPI